MKRNFLGMTDGESEGMVVLTMLLSFFFSIIALIVIGEKSMAVLWLGIMIGIISLLVGAYLSTAWSKE